MSSKADILLVTATEVESRALLKVAEESTGHPSRSLEVGHGTYRDLGKVNGKRILLIQSEMGAGGPGGAQQTVAQAIQEVNPDEVIMVGIAFGSKRETHEIGDVLVAKQLHMYEPQRRGKGLVIPRGDKTSATPRLLQRFRNASLDWTTAHVHIGLMLSGEKLIDDDEFARDLLSYEPEAIGGEMEGAGLYVSCLAAKKDWALVKAVCDWADGKKRKDKINRQLKAARNAALFVWHAIAHAPQTLDHESDTLPPHNSRGKGDYRGDRYLRRSPGIKADSATPARTPERITIREQSAAEIIANLKDGAPLHLFPEKAKELYIGRWTRGPGWQVIVYRLPSKRSPGWWCFFNEVDSGPLVGASTVQDLSALRLGDSATVSGRISDVSPLGSMLLEDAIILSDHVPFPQSGEDR